LTSLNIALLIIAILANSLHARLRQGSAQRIALLRNISQAVTSLFFGLQTDRIFLSYLSLFLGPSPLCEFSGLHDLSGDDIVEMRIQWWSSVVSACNSHLGDHRRRHESLSLGARKES
jgi:hypothetical protein